MRSDVIGKRKRGRPRINPNNIIDSIDMLNLKELGTQSVKTVKIHESTFFDLHDIKDADDSMKTMNDVISMLIKLYIANSYLES